MSFFDLFRKKLPYQHDALGPMKWHANTGWLAESVVLPFSESPVDVILAGDPAAPSQAASSALEQFLAEPGRLKTLVQGHLFELWQNYFSDQPPPMVLEGPEKIWGTEEWLTLEISDIDSCSVTFTFSWQAEEDDHMVTVYVEGGEVTGSSIDG